MIAKPPPERDEEQEETHQGSKAEVEFIMDPQHQQEYIKVDLELKRAHIQKMKVASDNVVMHWYLQTLAEMRCGLSMPTADDGANTVGENQKWKPAFDAMEIRRIEQRYIYLMDQLLKQLNPNYTPKQLDDKEK